MWYLRLDICLAADLQLIKSLSSGLKIGVCLSSSACTGMVGVAAVRLQDSSTLLLLLAPRLQGQCPHYTGQTSSSLSLHWGASHSLAGQIQMLISFIFRCAFERTVSQGLTFPLGPLISAGLTTHVLAITHEWKANCHLPFSSRARFWFCFNNC